MIFHSLGSNFFTFRQAIRPLFLSHSFQNTEKLKKSLEDIYQGQVTLVYKGREALELALSLSQIPKGSFVAINGFTCYAVYKAVVSQGFKVQYVDIEKNALDFSALSLEKALKRNPKIKAVIVQNSLGFPAEVPEIQKLCKKYNVVLIEDIAHSVGATYENGKEAGTEGDFTVLSLSQDKVLDSVSGGALIVRNKKFLHAVSEQTYQHVPLLVQMRDRFYPLFSWFIRNTYSLKIGKVVHWILHKLHFLSGPMDDLGAGFHILPSWQCALALEQFQKRTEIIHHRRSIAQVYFENLPRDLLLSSTGKNMARSSCLRFPLLVKNRQNLLSFLKTKGFHLSDIWYDVPIGPAKYMSLTDYAGECPNSEAMTQSMMNLPTHACMTQKQAKNLAQLVSLCQK